MIHVAHLSSQTPSWCTHEMGASSLEELYDDMHSYDLKLNVGRDQKGLAVTSPQATSAAQP